MNWYWKHREEVSKRRKERWRNDHKWREKCKDRRQKYWKLNRTRINKQRREYYHKHNTRKDKDERNRKARERYKKLSQEERRKQNWNLHHREHRREYLRKWSAKHRKAENKRLLEYSHKNKEVRRTTRVLSLWKCKILKHELSEIEKEKILWLTKQKKKLTLLRKWNEGEICEKDLHQQLQQLELKTQ